MLNANTTRVADGLSLEQHRLFLLIPILSPIHLILFFNSPLSILCASFHHVAEEMLFPRRQRSRRPGKYFPLRSHIFGTQCLLPCGCGLFDEWVVFPAECLGESRREECVYGRGVEGWELC